MFGETKDRKLDLRELAVGKRVFLNTIKWHQVRISDGSGIGDSIFTNAGIGLDRIYVTKKNFSLVSSVPNDILVHELTHVWQATNDGITGLGYKMNSIMHQGYHWARGSGRNAAYTYDQSLVGHIPWGMYPAEEQAQIVEDWFTSGEKRKHPAYRYIYWCIRRLYFTQGLWPTPPAP